MAAPRLTLAPPDPYNLKLTANVHPAGWVNLDPAPRYNLVVIGAGTAGLVTAAGAAGLGAKVALVERDFMGGDCLNFGCVPSKAMLRAARTAAEVRGAARMGVRVPDGVPIDFAAAMERMRRLRTQLSANDSAERFQRLGVDVFLGEAHFTGPDSVEADGKTLRFKRAAIATGARAAELPIPGLKQAGYLTNETVFSLTELPRRLAVIGGGPLGCELAQAFRRFGAEVTILEAMPQILIREDRDAAARAEAALVRDGVDVLTGCNITGIEKRAGEKLIRFDRAGAPAELVFDEILVGVGRAPMVDGLNLEAAGVDYDRQNGIKVDDHLRTTNPHIFAAGDICTPYKFTHMADAMARIVIRNALFFGRRRASTLTIPWCTYTDPEIAHVGLYEADAKTRGLRIVTFVQELGGVDRAVLDGATEGFIKLHVYEGSDRIAGATVVASHASEIISQLTLAITQRIGLGALAEMIYPYPTQAEAIKKVADAYNRTRLTPFLKRMFEKWFAWTR
jgi:pyruvate/2-oxoglutarate dehydrogenase complex dihydrolipoamide dehydrogenase (E3) component